MNRARGCNMKRLRIWMIGTAAALIVAAAAFLIFRVPAGGGSLAVQSAPSQTPAAPPPVVANTPAATQKATDTTSHTATTGISPGVSQTATPPDGKDQPLLLTSMLQKYGYSIRAVDAKQLLMLSYKNDGSTLYLYDKDSAGLWSLTQSFPAYAGKKGVTDNKVEGDKKTPAGYYAIGFGFGNKPKPDTEWEYRSVTKDTCWVDDPDSAFYNTWAEGTASKDWDSAAYLSGNAAYNYALVIEYNMNPVVPGKGSGIILHCNSGSSTGCVLVSEPDMLKILKWLDAGSDAHILIADAG